VTTIRFFERPYMTSLPLLALLVSWPGNSQESRDTVTIDELTWYLAGNDEFSPWSEGNEYCEALDAAGHDDWRLPSLLELEAVHDPGASNGIRSPLAFDDCCLWSSDSLVELEADTKGVLPGPTNDPSGYYWGFLFASGTRYYSFGNFPDGRAMCVRDAD